MLRIIILISILGFISGSILYAELIPKAVRGIDIVACSADGNPGTANVYSLCGKKCGTLTAILEFAKGFFPVLLGNILIPPEYRTYTFALIIIAPVMGHIFSIFHNWNGGLGIATTFGTMIAIFLRSRLLVLLVGDYAIGKFALKFRHKYYRTLFVFGAFLVELLLLNSKDAYSMAYFCIACIIILKCIAVNHKNSIQSIPK